MAAEEDPFQLLLNIRDGGVLDENFQTRNYNENEIQFNGAHVEKSLNVNESISFEEKKTSEEPIEIDLRNVYKTYGINPIDRTKQKLFKKQSNDIVNFSIGEARMKFVHGKNEEAINLLFEVIRMNPHNSEPYDALGDIYSKIGNYNKALEFYLLGIEFNQTDSKRWAELAELACFTGLYKSAIQFYTKAIKISPKNVTYYIKKCNLLEQMKQYENAYKTYDKLLNLLEPDDYRVILSIAFRVANILSQHMNCCSEALTLIETIMGENSIESDREKFDSFLIYLQSYFDLLLKNGQYWKLLRKSVQYNLLEVKVSSYDNEKLLSQIVKHFQQNEPFVSRTNILIDEQNELAYKSKLICAFIYLKKLDSVEKYLPQLEQLNDPTILEHTYRPLVEAFISVGNYQQAHRYASKLVEHFKCSKYWYWCGLCLNRIGMTEDSIVAYENAIHYDSNNYDAVNELSELCNQMGIPERALDKMNVHNELKIDSNLLANRCNLLFLCKRWNEFINSSRMLLGSEMYFFDNWDDISELITHSSTMAGLLKSAKTMRRRYSRQAARTELTGARLTSQQYFDCWKKCIFVLLNHLKQYDDAVRWAFSSFLSTYYEPFQVPLTLIAFRACFDSKYRSYTFDLGKFLLKEFRNSGSLWYAFSVMMNDIYQDCRHKRFCMRAWKENPNNINVMLMNGHIALFSGRYKHALGVYLSLYQMHSDYRYDSFHVAISYLHLICQSHTLDKCSLFTQMIAFLSDYIQKVGKCQESYYNVGRAFHQLGFYRYAVELYTIALHTPLKVHDQRFDLSPEIAFNLSQIYRHCNDHEKANLLLFQYCTI